MEKFSRTIRSFVLRQGRLTVGQQRALDTLWPRYGVEPDKETLDLNVLFGRPAPVILEIGFGNGDAIAQMATVNPACNFVGIEVHKPGVGHLLQIIEKERIENIRVLNMDAVEVLTTNIADTSLHGVNIFFPDPWHKKRHHKRRLVQPEFLALLARKLKSGGVLHIATDWEDYAHHVEEVISDQSAFEAATIDQALLRSKTRFEQRGQRLGHRIRDMVYRRI
jgi:tRNA (guanine-N7-)-methyltransferase